MEKRVDSTSPVPLYFQLKNNLIEDLKGYDTDDKFLTEKILCEKYGVSRITVRKSLDELVKEGYIKKERGRGSVVKKIPKLNQEFTVKLQSFNQEMLEKGFDPRTKVLKLECLTEPDSDLHNLLELNSSEEIVEMVRLRYVDGKPLVYLKTFFPKKIMKNFKEFDFVNQSFYDYLESVGLKVTSANRNFEAKIADEIEAKSLEIEKGDPIAYFETITYSNDKLVEFSKASYVGKFNKFSLKLIV